MACWRKETTGMEAENPLDTSCGGVDQKSGAVMSLLFIAGLTTMLGLAFSLITFSSKPLLIGIAVAMTLPVVIVGVLWFQNDHSSPEPRHSVARQT